MDKILYLNCRNFPDLPAFTKKKWLLMAAGYLGIDYIKDYNNEDGLRRDYILNIEPYFEIVKGNLWTGCWQMDVLIDPPRYKRDWDKVDTAFIAALGKGVEEKDNVVLLFQACDPIIHKRYPEEQEFDMVFCGSCSPHIFNERMRCIEIMQRKFKVADMGHENVPDQYVRNLSKGKVQFVCSLQSDLGDRELAQRFFEALAIGPVLVNYVDTLKYTGCVEGEDYLAYRNDEEMVAKMDLLLKDEELRNKIARSGRQKAIRYHTFEHRLMTILDYAFKGEK